MQQNDDFVRVFMIITVALSIICGVGSLGYWSYKAYGEYQTQMKNLTEKPNIFE